MPPVRVRVWFRISVRIRAGGQFSSGKIFLEPIYINLFDTFHVKINYVQVSLTHCDNNLC